MTLHYADDWLTVHHGDCREVMAGMESESVHCVVTSPPYWGLRDYGTPGQLGLEPTPEQYVENLVAVFREVRRVLRKDGTVWLNLGDSYAGSTMGGGPASSSTLVGTHHTEREGARFSGHPRGLAGLKPKDLVGIPWRVAFALQQPYYTGSIPDERNRTWLSALMDGEGTFTILSTTSPHGSGNSYPPIAQVRMTSQAVVQKAASLVGVASPAQYPPSNGGNRGVYQWRLSGRRAADVARELYPYLIEKRKQALIAWNHQEVRDGYTTKRGVTIPGEALAKQLVCRDLIRRLNRGEHVDVPSWMVEPPSLMEPGWYLRSDVIWSKPNPMPESVTDRPTKSHEYIFLLSKSPRYYFDADAVREPVMSSPSDIRKMTEQRPRIGGRTIDNVDPLYAANGSTNIGQKRGVGDPSGRNIRSVWTIATQPYPGAHFATFPEQLAERCIKAGTSEKGVCPECGAPWERVMERDGVESVGGQRFTYRPDGTPVRGDWRYDPLRNGGDVDPRIQRVEGQPIAPRQTTGWQTSCDCIAKWEHDSEREVQGGPTLARHRPSEPVPAVVLDPFAGSGTTGMVAQSLSRRAVLIDLSLDYLGQLMARNADIPLGLGA